MGQKKKNSYTFLSLIALGLIVTSCANYGMISENDVYLQAPTEINLQEDETDLTSYNAYKARQRGEFEDGRLDPRIPFKRWRSSYMIASLYAGPYFNLYGRGGMTSPFYGGAGMFGHGFYYNDVSYYGILHNHNYINGIYSPYTTFGMGYGYGYGYGSGYAYNGFGYGMHPYANAAPQVSNGTSNQPVFYGRRNNLSSSSNRSSSYPNTLKSGSFSTSNSNSNNQTNGTSRRSIQKTSSNGSEYSKHKSVTPVKQVGYNSSANTTNTRRTSYTPSTTVRRTRSVNSTPANRTSVARPRASSPNLNTRTRSTSSFSTRGGSTSSSSSPSSSYSSSSSGSTSRRR